MTSIDTNVSNYTLSELMSIVSVEDFDENEIIEKTNELTTKFKHKNPQLAIFFQAIQSQLLQYSQNLDPPSDDDDNNDPNKIHVEGFGTMSNEAIFSAGERQVTDWFENQNLTQSDQNQVDKITDRKQKIGVFGNQHAPMNRDQIATTDTFGVPVKQDSLNPNLKNTISRFVNLDSQFRQYTNGIDSTSTNYTLDLSDTLKNALSLTLYSYQIPFSWYAIDTAYGNTCLWILDASTNQAINVSIPSGNYNQLDFATQLNKSFIAAGFSFPAFPPANIPINTPVYYNPNSGIITLYLYDGSYNDLTNSTNNFTIDQTTQIIFYDFTGVLQCNNTCLSKNSSYFNNSLGWVMGYRVPYVNVDPSGNTASSILDLNGTKYLILVIDDYNQNHVNNSLVSISQFSNTLKIPSYYSPDIPYTCIQPGTNNLTQIVNEVTLQTLIDTQTTNVENGLLIAGKYEGDYSPTQISLPSAPRTLTKSQIYTINEINKSRNNITNYLAKAPTTSDILAVIPVKTSVGVPTGSLLVEFSGSLKDSSRTYFGPVNIERMAVKLLDDKGNVLNLNGNDWCVTLVCECLYQY
jgi:hypothetical protein